jgi:branched-chain amino acid transport system substrate-binding protein
MKAMPTSTTASAKGSIRADGPQAAPLLPFEVKQPSESKRAWDYYNCSAQRANQAFRATAMRLRAGAEAETAPAPRRLRGRRLVA